MVSHEPLDDVAFLARSPHRVAVLDSLADGPRTRPVLHEETGVSQPTLGRILGSFEGRNWVERDGREYALTPWGGLLAEEFGDLIGTVETIQRLGDVVRRLPTDGMDFDVRRLGSATVTTPEPGDVFRHVRRFEEVVFGATHVRLLTDTMAADSLAKLHDRVQRAPDDLFVESVLTADALTQALDDPALAGLVRDLVRSGRTPVYEFDGSIPQPLGLADGVGLLAPTDEHGIPGALVESEDEVVRAWLTERLDDHRDRATRLTDDDLPS